VDPITSVRNPHVRALAALARARERRERGRHLAEGPNAIAEALAAGVVEEVLGVPDALVGLPVPPEVRTTAVAPHVLERITDTVTPQGVIAVVRTPVASLEDVVGDGLLLVLHEVADPGNAGTIVRSADAAGARGVVLTTGSVDPFSPKAVRASAGSVYHLPVVVDVELGAVVAACREHGQRILGLDGRAPTSVFTLRDTAAPVALVLGNEAHGLPAALVDALDGTVAVPILGRAESLNVAAAAAVALYAAAEGLRTGGGG
jgi:RNA methyltransferase, TrmH family